MNLAFVNGIFPMTPYHFGPLNLESNIIFKQLDKLNRLDVITVNSQPYNEYIHHDGKLHRQRPYVRFYYPTNKISSLIKSFLSKCESAVAMIQDPLNDNVEIYNDNVVKPLIKNGRVPLHIMFENNQWIDYFGTTLDLYGTKSDELFDFIDTKFEKLVGREILYCSIVDTQFSNDMFDILIKVAHSLFLE